MEYYRKKSLSFVLSKGNGTSHLNIELSYDSHYVNTYISEGRRLIRVLSKVYVRTVWAFVELNCISSYVLLATYYLIMIGIRFREQASRILQAGVFFSIPAIHPP